MLTNVCRPVRDARGTDAGWTDDTATIAGGPNPASFDVFSDGVVAALLLLLPLLLLLLLLPLLLVRAGVVVATIAEVVVWSGEMLKYEWSMSASWRVTLTRTTASAALWAGSLVE